jgi:hypothetical protein
MGKMHCSQHVEKLLFKRVWEGKDQRHGQVFLRGVIPPVPTFKPDLIPFYQGSCLRLAKSFYCMSFTKVYRNRKMRISDRGADIQLTCGKRNTSQI